MEPMSERCEFHYTRKPSTQTATESSSGTARRIKKKRPYTPLRLNEPLTCAGATPLKG